MLYAIHMLSLFAHNLTFEAINSEKNTLISLAGDFGEKLKEGRRIFWATRDEWFQTFSRDGGATPSLSARRVA